MTKVLVVDDSVAVARKLQQIIEAAPGLTFVGHAKDGAQGVAEYRQLTPDVVLMDLVMPNMDGLTAIRAIRAIDPEAKIIVLSSVAGISDKVEQALKFGALKVLSKPFTDETVTAAIAAVTGR